MTLQPGVTRHLPCCWQGSGSQTMEEDGHNTLAFMAAPLELGRLCHLHQQRSCPSQMASAPFTPPCCWKILILPGAQRKPRAWLSSSTNPAPLSTRRIRIHVPVFTRALQKAPAVFLACTGRCVAQWGQTLQRAWRRPRGDKAPCRSHLFPSSSAKGH